MVDRKTLEPGHYTLYDKHGNPVAYLSWDTGRIVLHSHMANDLVIGNFCGPDDKSKTICFPELYPLEAIDENG